MSAPPPATLTRKDRVISKLVSFLARALYRDIEVYWAQSPPTAGPELTASNHFGGLADGIVLLYVLPRRPGIIARDLIWKVPVVGQLMSWIGGIPVHKPSDRKRPISNAEMFGSCIEALREGRHLLIFPEGVTREEPSIAPVRTGAARIVLGARDAGVTDIVITPVGIHYEDRAALRSRIVVNAVRPIEVDRTPGLDRVSEPGDGPDRDAVVKLTADIDHALRRAAPDFEDWDEARDLTNAAEVALRGQLDDPLGAMPNELRVRLANTLAARPPTLRKEVREAIQRYRAHLDRLGLQDVDVLGRRRRTLGLLVLQLLIAIVLFPFALAGALLHLVPFLLVKAVGLVRMSPPVLATVKPFVAVLAFGATWGVVVWRALSAFGLVGAGAAVFLLPVYLAITIVFADRAALMLRRSGGRSRSRRLGSLPDELVSEREDVVQAVWSR